MNARQLTWLGLAALAMLLGAVWIGVARKPDTNASTALFPALKGQLAKVQAVQIFAPTEQVSVELNRTATGWSVKQRNNYSADTAKVNALLLSLEDAKIREEKTSNPDNYATLGIQDLNEANASGARVELIGSEPVVKLIVGKADAAARATYVRRAGEAKSWLVSELFSLETDAASWLHRDLINVNADRIQAATVQLANASPYMAIKSQRADANFDVTPLPKKRELNSVGAANSVAQALVSLQLDDVRPFADIAGAKADARTTLQTFDGLVIIVSGYASGEKHWITLKANVDEALAKRFYLPTTLPAMAADKPATASPDDAFAAATAKVRTEAESLNKQSGEWAYAIANYKYDALFKPVEQLLRKP